MKTVYNASHFFKKGIALSLLIFAGLAVHANPSLHEAPHPPPPPPLNLKGKVSSSASECTYALSATSNSVGVGAGAGVTVTVTVTPTGTSCTTWTAAVSPGSEWITVTSGASVTGTGTVTYSYRANMATTPREGTLTIAGQTYTVTQAGRPLAADSYEGDAGNNTPATAHLFAANFSPRLQLDAVASIDISSATCDIASDVDIYKIILPTDYTYTLTATLFDSYNQINHSNYTLDAKISCSTDGSNWSSSRDVTLTTTVSGGTLYLKIEPYFSGNTGTYAAKIELKAGCRGVLSESKKSVTREAGVGELTVTTGPSCIWTAASNVYWITVTSEANAIGSGNVSYSYTENTLLASRTETITIAGEPYTVTQAPAPDRYDRHEDNNTVARATLLASEAIQNDSVIHISSANCHLTSDVDYYKIELVTGYTYRLSGALYDSENPNGDNRYTLDAKISYSINNSNWSDPNDKLLPATVSGGTLYLKIEPFSPHNSASVGTYAAKIEIKRARTTDCTYTLSPANKQVLPGAGSDQVAVTTSAETCFWGTTSDVKWITVESGSGTGGGHAAYSYLANMSPNPRTGHLTIADQTYTVTQAGRTLAADTYEGDEGNNTQAKAYPLPAPTFNEHNVGTVDISEAICHLAADVDFYKRELEPGDTYRFSGALHDRDNQVNNSNDSLDAKISYSSNNSNWSDPNDSQLSSATVQGGSLYLKILPYSSGNTGTYAAKIEIKRVAATGCTYNLSSDRKAATAPASSDRVTVTATGSSCVWTAESNVGWITITSGSGTGEGNVGYSYTENTSLYSRTGTITIADKTYTVTQARRPVPPDTYEPNNSKEEARLLPANFSPSLQPNAIASIDISSASCHLTSDEDYYKIELETGYTYTFSGVLCARDNRINNSNPTLDVKISYSTNGTDWSDTADFWLSPKTVQGGTLYLKIEPYSGGVGTYAAKIDIRAGCRAFLPLLRKTAPSAAGSDQITVISGSSCTSSWTAASSADWLTFTGGARTATSTGNITYSYAANPIADLRTGAIIVAGQVYTVTQAPSPDSYEPNNTPAALQQPNSPSSLTPEFNNQNAGVIRISPANCHPVDDVDIYKINLEAGYAYDIRGALYDLYNPQGNSHYTLDAQIYYSTDEGENWSYSYGSEFSVSRTLGGNPLYLKIVSVSSSDEEKMGTYAAEINISRTVACTYTLSERRKQVTSAAGSGVSVTVTASSSCTAPWEARSNASWITLTPASRGSRTGSGSITYSYLENTEWVSRTGTITIAGKTYTVTQMHPSIDPDRYEGDEGNNTAERAALLTATFANNASVINISQANCHLASDVDYYKIELEAGYTYTLSGTLYDSYSSTDGVNYTLDAKISYSANNGANWSNSSDTGLPPAAVPGGTLHLKIEPYYSGRVGTYAAKIEITRSACAYAFSPARGAAPATGGPGEVTVTTACFWEAVSNADWITLSQTSGTGTTTLTYSVATNTGEEREGTITIARQTYTVRQEAAPCAYSFRESSVAIPAEASTDRRAEIITTRESCQWTSSSHADWITLSQTSGTGTTTLTYSVATNTGEEREGTITIAGQTYTVRQEAAPCAYSFRESSVAIPAEASTDRRAEITATRESCQWTASSNADWITLSRTSGTGTTTLTYSVATNTGEEREGTI